MNRGNRGRGRITFTEQANFSCKKGLRKTVNDPIKIKYGMDAKNRTEGTVLLLVFFIFFKKNDKSL